MSSQPHQRVNAQLQPRLIILCSIVLAYALWLSTRTAGQKSGFQLDASVLIFNIAAVGLLLMWELQAERRTLQDLGLSHPTMWRSFLIGILAGFVVLTAGITLFSLVGPVRNPLQGLRSNQIDFAALLILQAGISAALVEELIFRGVMYDQFFQRAGKVSQAIIGSSALYAAWHAGFLYYNTRYLGADFPLPVPAVIGGALLGLFGVGVVLGVLRWRTRSIAVPFVVHWVAAGLLVIAPHIAA